MNAIDIHGVSKTFGSHAAVSNVSLAVPEGTIYGFIGPNGSGKTTTIRMIMNIILPDSGEIEVLGRRGTGAARDDVSYLPEERGLYKQMPVRRLLRYYGRLKGRTPRDDAKGPSRTAADKAKGRRRLQERLGLAPATDQ